MVTTTTQALQTQKIDESLEVRLFHSTGLLTVVWLLIRVWLGAQWVAAGLEKLQNPRWLDGTILTGFWQGAVAAHQGPHPAVAYDWYAGFLQTLLANQVQTWFAGLVAYGELLTGICLILGLLTGLVALNAGFMNFNYMLAGSASVNPVFFVLALVLVLAWRRAGWWGLDRLLLPALRTGVARRRLALRPPPVLRPEY